VHRRERLALVMKNRNLKLLIAFISPPIMGTFILVSYDVLIRVAEGRFGPEKLWEQIKSMPIAIIFAFLLVGLQSAIYAILMEFLVTPYVTKPSWFVVSSCLLGSCFGLTLLIVLPAEAASQLVFTGASVGTILGFWLLKINRRGKQNG